MIKTLYLVFIHLLLGEVVFMLLNEVLLLLLLLLHHGQLLPVLLRERHHVELSRELVQS